MEALHDLFVTKYLKVHKNDHKGFHGTTKLSYDLELT
jgi:hypothetical protein